MTAIISPVAINQRQLKRRNKTIHSFIQVEKAFAEKWGVDCARSARTLMCYRVNALKKMVAFSQAHREEIITVFGDDIDSEENTKPEEAVETRACI